MVFVLAMSVMRAVDPLNNALAAFVGAVAALLLYAFAIQPFFRRSRYEPPPLSLGRFLLALAIIILLAAAAWEWSTGVLAAVFLGVCVGLLIGDLLPRRRAPG